MKNTKDEQKSRKTEIDQRKAEIGIENHSIRSADKTEKLRTSDDDRGKEQSGTTNTQNKSGNIKYENELTGNYDPKPNVDVVRNNTTDDVNQVVNPETNLILKERKPNHVTDPIIEIINSQIINTSQRLTEVDASNIRPGIKYNSLIKPIPIKDGLMSLRVLKNEIPSFFTFTNTSSGMPISVLPINGEINNAPWFPLYVQALKNFPNGSVTIRYTQELNSLVKVPNAKDVSKEELLSITSVIGSQEQPSLVALRVANRLADMIRAYESIDKLIIATPSKINIENYVVPNDLEQVLALKPCPYDRPHPIFLLLNSDIQWWQNEIRNLSNAGPIAFGELEVQSSPTGIKEEALWGLATDQYMATILNNNATQLIANSITAEELINIYHAVTIPILTDVKMYEPFNKLYMRWQRPVQEEISGFWIMMNVAQPMKVQVIETLSQIVESTSMVALENPSTVLTMNNIAQRTTDVSMNNRLKQDLAAGKPGDFSSLIVLDMYVGQVDVTLELSNSSDNDGNIVILWEALSWFAAFKGIANANYHELGYIITTALENIVGARIMAGWLNINGWYKQFDNGVWQVLDRTKKMRTTKNQPSTIRPSIFVPAIRVGNNRNDIANRLYGLIERIRLFCNTRFVPVGLDRKRRAAYFPFDRDNFEAYMSHQMLGLQEFNQGDVGPARGEILAMNAIIDDARALSIAANGDRYRENSPNDWWKSMTMMMDQSANRASIVMNLTIATLQEWIANQPLYVTEGKPNTNGQYEFFTSPNIIGFRGEPQVIEDNNLFRGDLVNLNGNNNNVNNNNNNNNDGNNGGDNNPNNNQNQQNLRRRLLQATPIKINNPEYTIDFAMALNVILCGRGMVWEPITSIEVLSANAKDGLNKRSRGIMIMQPNYEALITLYQTCNSYSQSGSLALMLIYWISHPNAINHPFAREAQLLSRMLRIANWKTFMFKLVELTNGLSANDILDLLNVNGTIDARFIQPILVYIDKLNYRNELPPIPDSRFYVMNEILPDHVRPNLGILSSLFLDLRSPLKLVNRGIFIGRLILDNRIPILTRNQIMEQYNYVQNVTTINYVEGEGPNGKTFTIQLNDGRQFNSPVDSGLRGVIFQVDQILDIRSDNLKRFIYQSTAANFTGIMFTNKEVYYDFADATSKTQILDELFDNKLLIELLTSPTSEELYHVFMDTRYATNVSRAEYVVNKYIQWVTMFDQVGGIYRDTLITSALINTTDPPLAHHQMNWDMFKFGDGVGNGQQQTINGVPKLALPYPNFNNSVRTFTSEKYNQSLNMQLVPLNPFNIIQVD